MKSTTLLIAAVGMLNALTLSAQDIKIVTSRGTLSEYEPGTRFVMKEASGPVTYHYGPKVVYRTSSGVVISETEYRTRFVPGTPIRVHYVNEGDRRVIQRVVLRDRGDKDDDDDDNQSPMIYFVTRDPIAPFAPKKHEKAVQVFLNGFLWFGSENHTGQRIVVSEQARPARNPFSTRAREKKRLEAELEAA